MTLNPSFVLLTILAGGLVLAACGSDTNDTSPGETDADTDADADTDSDTDSDADYFEPVAVGVELSAGYDAAAGTLTEYTFDGKNFYPPYLVLTFANLDFFDMTETKDRNANSCVVAVAYDFVTADPALETLDYDTGKTLDSWDSWDGSVTFTSDNFSLDTPNCDNWDEAVYPGGGPVETFSGMHVGIAVGPFSEYPFTNWNKKSLEQVGDSAFTVFVALNHPDGSGGLDFLAYNWDAGVLFEMDMSTHTVFVDKDDNMIFATDFLTGGLVSSYAYWFEDFPNLDLGTITEGSP